MTELLYFALVSFQPVLTETAALTAGFVILLRLTVLFVQFIHSIFEE